MYKDGKIDQNKADDFLHCLSKIRRNYLTPEKEDVAKTDLQEVTKNIQFFT